MSETPLDTQVLQYTSDFSTTSSSNVLDDSENLQKESPTLQSLYEASLDTQKSEYSETEMSSCFTEDRSENSSDESINLHFSKLKPYDLKPVCEPYVFLSNQSLRVKQKNKEQLGTQIGVSVVNASLRLLIQKTCVVMTLTKFLKNYLKGKNALKNQTGSEWFAWKNQYYMFHYQPLIIYAVILWKIWIIVHIDL